MFTRLIFSLLLLSPLSATEPLGWPEITSESKPWTRWWWLGSAVDRQNLTRELEDFAKAGIGGVEICPIYGAKGAETKYLPFLSESWVAAVAHTVREAERLGIQVDLTTGTGWPFGGPMVEPNHSSRSLEPWSASLAGPARHETRLPSGEILKLVATNDNQILDLEPMVNQGRLIWDTPPGQ